MDGAAHNIPEVTARPRRRTYHRQLGRYEPLRFGPRSWYRFRDDRTAISCRRVRGQPDERQAGIIEAMFNAEWQALRLEAEAEAAETAKERYSTLHLAVEFRRQQLLLDRDLAATMRKPPSPAKAKPGVPQLDLEAHMARLRERREGAAS
jgi:hypothetical protein